MVYTWICGMCKGSGWVNIPRTNTTARECCPQCLGKGMMTTDS